MAETQASVKTVLAQAALRRYALAQTNWTAADLAVNERLLASLPVGLARLAAKQLAASHSATAD